MSSNLPDIITLSPSSPIVSDVSYNSQASLTISLACLDSRLRPCYTRPMPGVTLQTQREKTGFKGYPDDFKNECVQALRDAGYPQTFGSLAQVCKEKKVAASTLITWAALADYKIERDPQAETSLLITLIVSELVSIFDTLAQKRDRASYSQLSIGMGILFDKLFMLTGNIPEIKVDLVHRIAEAITAPWSSDRAITNDSAEIVDSDAVSGDSDGQDTDDADDGEYS